MHGPSWNVKLKMQLWIDCGCTVHTMDLRTENVLEENTWYYQQQCETTFVHLTTFGCSECLKSHQIIPVCFVIICLLTLFHLLIFEEVLIFKRPPLSALLVYHCIEFFPVILNARKNNHFSQLHKICHLCLMNVTISLRIFLLSSMYLALIWEVILW